MDFNLADLFEAAVDAFGSREYLVAGSERRTYEQMESRANRLAHHLLDVGIRPGDHVGIYATNSAEWVESAWAIFKIRAVWVNINYRYVAGELRYLFSNADLVALAHQAQFSEEVAALLPELPALRHVVTIGASADRGAGGMPCDDAVDYETAIAGGSPERDFPERSGDDLYILYTGGTTGLPKGVVWHHRDVFFALGGGIDALTGERVERPEQMVEKGKAGGPITFLPIAPLMHGATQWAVMGQSFLGNKIVLVPRFDPAEVWRLVEAERVNMVMITGDAMGKPLVECLDEPGASYDLSSLIGLTSSAALFSPAVKDAFFAHFPNLVMTDAVGSSEAGNNGLTLVRPGDTAMVSGPTVRSLGKSVVLDEQLRPVEPGSGVVGKIARAGDIPVCYYNDPVKTAEVFVTAGGVSYVMPGDFATVEADGSITLLGRGSICINSGGEKIFPEEVEAVVRAHPDVMDAIVLGAPDERFGQRVAAIVEARKGHLAPSLEDLQAHCRGHVAGYKVPRELHVVERIERSPSGKPDYPWANAIVEAASAPSATPAGAPPPR
ncbi:MAG: acyl-CoA synthetase [Actinomycetota bacterium]|nr:acyl-CoA synthetase [Actinomycetota bacterium]